MKRNDILYILIPTSLLIFIWIGFNIQHNAITSTIPESTNIQIQSINPYFDTKTIEELKKRKSVIPISNLRKDVASPSATPSPTQQPQNNQIATPSAVATQSAR